MATIESKLRHRIDPAALWAAVNPVLLRGEMAFDEDTKGLKVGDGTTAWSALPYRIAPDAIDPAPGSVPANTALPVISGTAQEGATLTGTDGAWSNSPTSYARQWLRGGSAISGATSSAYVLQGSDVGSTITLRVLASNGAGPAASPAVSAATSTIAAAGPPAPDTRPRYGSAAAGAYTTPVTLLAALTAYGSNGTVAGSFSVAPPAGQYGWFACTLAAYNAGPGVQFLESGGSGYWSGAGSAGDFAGSTEFPRSTTKVDYSDGTTAWVFLRQDYINAAGSFDVS